MRILYPRGAKYFGIEWPFPSWCYIRFDWQTDKEAAMMFRCLIAALREVPVVKKSRREK